MNKLSALQQNIMTHSDLLTVFGGRYPLESRIRKGVYIRLARGHYMHSRNWEQLDPAQQHLACAIAHAANNPDYILSHYTAALIHDLPGISVPDKIHTYCLSRTRARDIVLHQGDLHLPTDTTVFLPGIRVTSLERTLEDLAVQDSLIAAGQHRVLH